MREADQGAVMLVLSASIGDRIQVGEITLIVIGFRGEDGRKAVPPRSVLQLGFDGPRHVQITRKGESP